MFFDTYLIPANNSEAAIRERGSRFFAFAYCVNNLTEIKSQLHEIKQKFPDATHHCYAYVLGTNKEIQFATDDGEPGNSAGKPILRRILAADFSNCLVVVVRYFGGTQLGIPGLIKAYGECADAALKGCGKKEKSITFEYKIAVQFEHESDLQRLCTKLSLEVINRAYSDGVVFTVLCIKSKTLELEAFVKSNSHIFQVLK